MLHEIHAKISKIVFPKSPSLSDSNLSGPELGERRSSSFRGLSSSFNYRSNIFDYHWEGTLTFNVFMIGILAIPVFITTFQENVARVFASFIGPLFVVFHVFQATFYTIVASLSMILIYRVIDIIPFSSLKAGFLGDGSELIPWTVLLAFLTLAYLCISLETTGLLGDFASLAASRAENATTLFFLVFITSAILTIFTSNDAVILCTPIVSHLAREKSLNPEPFYYAGFMAANVLSMLTKYGNPTNLIAAQEMGGLNYGDYMKLMIFPTIITAVVCCLSLYLYFRRNLMYSFDFEEQPEITLAGPPEQDLGVEVEVGSDEDKPDAYSEEVISPCKTPPSAAPETFESPLLENADEDADADENHGKLLSPSSLTTKVKLTTLQVAKSVSDSDISVELAAPTPLTALGRRNSSVFATLELLADVQAPRTPRMMRHDWVSFTVEEGVNLEITAAEAPDRRWVYLARLLICLTLMIIMNFVDGDYAEDWIVCLFTLLACIIMDWVWDRMDAGQGKKVDVVCYTLRSVPWFLLVFVPALFACIETLDTTPVLEDFSRRLRDDFGSSEFSLVFFFTLLTVVLSQCFTNLGATIFMAKILRHDAFTTLSQRKLNLCWACVIYGTNVGGTVTLLGALAGILWQSFIVQMSESGGADPVTYVSYLKKSLIITPLFIFIGSLSVWASVAMQGFDTDPQTETFAEGAWNCPGIDPQNCLYFGHTFLGLSVTRFTGRRFQNENTVTRQTVFDIDTVQDRNNTYFCEVNDDGWLAGGGQSAETTFFDVPDSAHITLVELGTLNASLGGVDYDDLVRRISTFEFPPFRLRPKSRVGWNPPYETYREIELGFDFDAETTRTLERLGALFADIPCSWTPGHMHLSMLRKPYFKTKAHEKSYFEWTESVISEWNREYSVLTCDECGFVEGGFYLYKNRNEIMEYFPPTLL